MNTKLPFSWPKTQLFRLGRLTIAASVFVVATIIFGKATATVALAIDAPPGLKLAPPNDTPTRGVMNGVVLIVPEFFRASTQIKLQANSVDQIASVQISLKSLGFTPIYTQADFDDWMVYAFHPQLAPSSSHQWLNPIIYPELVEGNIEGKMLRYQVQNGETVFACQLQRSQIWLGTLHCRRRKRPLATQ